MLTVDIVPDVASAVVASRATLGQSIREQIFSTELPDTVSDKISSLYSALIVPTTRLITSMALPAKAEHMGEKGERFDAVTKKIVVRFSLVSFFIYLDSFLFLVLPAVQGTTVDCYLS